MTQGVVYILQCSNGEYYVGSTTDLENRLNEHQKGRGCGFTKAHLPVKLVYTEEYPTIEEAYKQAELVPILPHYVWVSTYGRFQHGLNLEH